jgi:hypothetical protein
MVELLNDDDLYMSYKQELKDIKADFSWAKVACEWSKDLFSKPNDRIIIKDRLKWVRSFCSPEMNIVDIGGNGGHTFQGWDRSNITTVDIDKHDVENFVQCDVEKGLPFKDKEFDVAVMGEICEHLKDPVLAMQEALRVAKKVIVTVPYEYEWPSHYQPFYKADDKVKESGKTRHELAEEASSTVLEYHTDDNLDHLWHERHYTYDQFKKDVLQVSENVNTYKLSIPDSGWAFLGAVIHD